MKINSLKSSIAIGIIIISLSISYYFLKILPSQNQATIHSTEQNLKEKCTELGKAKYKEEKEEEKSAQNGTFLTPNYTYNKTLETCLYKGIFTSNIGYRTEYIIDLYTNKTLTTSDYYNNELIYGINEEEFFKKEQELMN